MFAALSNGLKTLSAYLPPGLFLSLSTSYLADSKYLPTYRHEFMGSILMIAFTFSAGRWWGVHSLAIAWLSHALGVVASDYVGGGPHANPAVSVSMWALGQVSYTEMYVRIAGQMGGGLVAFPLLHYLSNTLGWNSLAGPEFPLDKEDDTTWAMIGEFAATVLLCTLIYILNFELHFGTHHYWIKQTLTALGIRCLIQSFPTSGPAFNPMLGTAWAVFTAGFHNKIVPTSILKDGSVTESTWTSIGSYPTELEHYLVYWAAPLVGALLASLGYAIFSGKPYFGYKLPIGPFKKGKSHPTTSTTADTKSTVDSAIESLGLKKDK